MMLYSRLPPPASSAIAGAPTRPRTRSLRPPLSPARDPTRALGDDAAGDDEQGGRREVSSRSCFATARSIEMYRAAAWARSITRKKQKRKKKLLSRALARRRLPEPLAASLHAPAGPPGAAANSERAPAAAAPPTPPPPRACPTLALPRRCRLLAAAGESGSPSAGAFSTTAAASSRVASGVLGSPSAGSSSRAPAGELWWAQGGNNPIQERWDGILAQGSPSGSYAWSGPCHVAVIMLQRYALPGLSQFCIAIGMVVFIRILNVKSKGGANL
uniref:Uncharacterized protein n=1 Tax=Oryza rufipogon TaxID=4529 RepID=A0A0E0P3B1_ORYRU